MHVHVDPAAGGLVRLPTSHVAVVICIFVSFLLFKTEKNILQVLSTVVGKLHDFYPSPNMKKIRLAGHVTRMSEYRKNIQNFD